LIGCQTTCVSQISSSSGRMRPNSTPHESNGTGFPHNERKLFCRRAFVREWPNVGPPLRRDANLRPSEHCQDHR
jgi:hypothetical protein